jgi:hypothetical protein
LVTVAIYESVSVPCGTSITPDDELIVMLLLGGFTLILNSPDDGILPPVGPGIEPPVLLRIVYCFSL